MEHAKAQIEKFSVNKINPNHKNFTQVTVMGDNQFG
jgi:alpha-tubulin suppressor-like RCC1 family protein